MSVCTETAVNIGYSCRLLTEDIDETFTVDGESHDAVLSQLTNAASVMQNKPSPASANDSGMIVADDGAGQYVVKTFSNGSLAKLQLSLSVRDGQNTSTVSFRDDLNTTAETGQYALVISGHSLVSTSPVSVLIHNLSVYHYKNNYRHHHHHHFIAWLVHTEHSNSVSSSMKPNFVVVNLGVYPERIC